MVNNLTEHIRISKETKNTLDKIKLAEGEYYDSIIKRLINLKKIYDKKVKQ